jgi:lipoate-protein ligase A
MDGKTFRWIRSGPRPGPLHMALDEVLAAADPVLPAVRVYRWEPWTLSLGHFQRVTGADLAPWQAAGFGATRRATGGGAILHGDEVTYTLVLPAEDPRLPRSTAASYGWVHGAVAEALAACGVAVDGRTAPAPPAGAADPFFCFDRAAPIDLLARGRKLVGSAQRRTARAFLQHGSLPLSPNGSAPGATSLAEEAGSPSFDGASLEEALGAAFARLLGAAAVPSTPTPAEEAAAAEAAAARFGNPAWILRPWRGRGRPSAPPPPAPPAGEPPPAEPLRLLRSLPGEEGLAVLAAAGGARPLLPHAALRAVDAARLPRTEERRLAVDRDPWDSTFRRSTFAAGREGADPEGSAPAAARIEGEAAVLLLAWEGAPGRAVLEPRRHNFRDLPGGPSGDPERDAAAWLALLLRRAPAAARGPGAVALLAGRPLPLLAGPEVLARRVALLAPPRGVPPNS